MTLFGLDSGDWSVILVGALLGQAYLSRSLCGIPAPHGVFPLYRHPSTLSKHGTPQAEVED
jgi:hypothetical protein